MLSYFIILSNSNICAPHETKQVCISKALTYHHRRLAGTVSKSVGYPVVFHLQY